jgi:hypothetical protein
MTLATAIALFAALTSAGDLINKIIEERRAAGHPENAPLSPEHQAAIFSALKNAAMSIPKEHQDAISAAMDTWDETHAGEGG